MPKGGFGVYSCLHPIEINPNTYDYDPLKQGHRYKPVVEAHLNCDLRN